jgi:hypothetical protein
MPGCSTILLHDINCGVEDELPGANDVWANRGQHKVGLLNTCLPNPPYTLCAGTELRALDHLF